MQRAALALFLGGVLLSMTGCPTGTVSPIGNWLLVYDAGCDTQGAVQVQLQLLGGGDAIAVGVPSANWSYDSSTGVIMIALIYGNNDAGIRGMTGAFNGDTMGGTYSATQITENGCWSATRQQ